jgi:hypothetical protein
VNLRSEGTNPRATGTNPRAMAGAAPQPKGPFIITNAAELKDFLALFPPKRRKRKARNRTAAIEKRQWQETLREISKGREPGC